MNYIVYFPIIKTEWFNVWILWNSSLKQRQYFQPDNISTRNSSGAIIPKDGSSSNHIKTTTKFPKMGSIIKFSWIPFLIKLSESWKFNSVKSFGIINSSNSYSISPVWIEENKIVLPIRNFESPIIHQSEYMKYKMIFPAGRGGTYGDTLRLDRK